MDITTDRIRLMFGDCVERMKEIDEGSIDLTVTSPPYDNLRTYENTNKAWSEYVWKEVLLGLYHITKGGGVVVWVVGDATIKGSETGTSFKQALYAKEIGFNLHDTMIYRKRNPIPLKHNRYQQCFEFMFIFSKEKPLIFNPLQQNCTEGSIQRNRYTNMNSGFKKSDGKRSNRKTQPNHKTRTKDNVFCYTVGTASTMDKLAFKHPAIFPEQLAEDHILSWSNPGNIVFDPFMGSGTTGKMAVKNNRKFIGVEMVPKYYGIACDRILREVV